MPVKITQPAAADDVHSLPFIGPIHHTAQIAINVTTLTSAEIDADGYLKPGVPFQANGTLITAAAQVVFGVSIEPIQVAAGNTAPQIAAADSSFQIALATIAQINRAAAEDILGRAYTANEVAGFALAGSLIKLL